MMVKRLSGDEVKNGLGGEEGRGKVEGEADWLTVDELAAQEGARWEAGRLARGLSSRQKWIQELLGEWDRTVKNCGEQKGVVWDEGREVRDGEEGGRD